MKKIEVLYIPSNYCWLDAIKAMCIELSWIIGIIVLSLIFILGLLASLSYIIGYTILAGA